MHETPSRPDLLVPVPRSDNRGKLGITMRLPFTGADIWTAYEVSWLDACGKPEVGIATIVFPAESPNLIESKSLKQYLHSLNQARFASRADVIMLLQDDLGSASGSPARVDLSLSAGQRIAELEGETVDGLDLRIETYEPEPGFLVSYGPTVS